MKRVLALLLVLCGAVMMAGPAEAGTVTLTANLNALLNAGTIKDSDGNVIETSYNTTTLTLAGTKVATDVEEIDCSGVTSTAILNAIDPQTDLIATTIGLFTNLKTLKMPKLCITTATLPVFTGNTKLEVLDLSGSTGVSGALALGTLTSLKTVNLSGTVITSVTLPVGTSASAANTTLTTVNLSNCAALDNNAISTVWCTALTTLNLSNAAKVVTATGTNDITVAGCSSLEELNMSGASFATGTGLDITVTDSGVKTINLSKATPAAAVVHLKIVDTSANPVLETVNLSEATIATAAAGSFTVEAPTLKTLNISDASVTNNNVTLALGANTTADVTCAALQTVDASGSGFTTVATVANGAVSGVTGALKELNVSRSSKLTTLTLSGTAAQSGFAPELTTLNASECAALTALDVTKCGKLETLDVSGCTLLGGTLDLVNNTELANLNISGTKLASMPGIENCTKLTALDMSETTALTALDLTVLPNVASIDAHDSALTKVTTEANSTLKELNLAGCADLTQVGGTANTVDLSDLSGVTTLSIACTASNPNAGVQTAKLAGSAVVSADVRSTNVDITSWVLSSDKQELLAAFKGAGTGARTYVISGEPDDIMSGDLVVTATTAAGKSSRATVHVNITSGGSGGSSSGGCDAGFGLVGLAVLAGLFGLKRK